MYSKFFTLLIEQNIRIKYNCLIEVSTKIKHSCNKKPLIISY